MEPMTPNKKIKSPGQDAIANPKTSITCTDVPDSLFDATAAKKHFSKFGRVQRIRLFPKKQMCIIEYDQPVSAERAVLNAGAYDGFMFDVVWTKQRVRRRSKRDDDPDWVPDSDVEEELSAMQGAPTYRMSRQKPLETESNQTNFATNLNKPKLLTRVVKQSPVRKKVAVREKPKIVSQPIRTIEPIVPVTITQTSLSTLEAAAELHQLRSRISLTPNEQWRTLDARDKILRSWGGAGARLKLGGATIGTCADMCPEKERLHRQAEYQVMTLETVIDSDGQLEPWRAVKQYSRSSADQEIPMCYELRPASVLMMTCAYLLHEIADTTRQVSLADWFHFMWDRLRGIRKDIAQQALCCVESIQLVEMCARFHAHCAARLADLEHTQFDQRLNTDNLTKCLQTLKYMYADVGPEQKPREAEFRGYVALLNLGDANFWWEIKQLPQHIQKSDPITFALQVFNALDNNNYIRFFRLVREKATYLQACILLRYFNDVRARALAGIVKAYAPRGGSRYPAEELMNALAFESIESMKSFINHYGLRFAKTDEYELSVILNRNHFIEDSDPYPVARAMKLIESKRQSTVGEVIAGGNLPVADFRNHILYSSFNRDGTLKKTALIAEDQGYNTTNDSNNDIEALKAEVQKLAQDGKGYGNTNREVTGNILMKPDMKPLFPKTLPSIEESNKTKSFSFKPAIPVALTEIIENSPEKVFTDTKNAYSFSKPADSIGSNLFMKPDSGNLFKSSTSKGPFDTKSSTNNDNIFGKASNETRNIFQTRQNTAIFGGQSSQDNNIFKKPEVSKSVFGQANSDTVNKNVFGNIQSKSIFSKSDGENSAFISQNTFSNKNVFSKSDNLFAKSTPNNEDVKHPSNIFGKAISEDAVDSTKTGKLIFAPNGDNGSKVVSPGTLFKSVCEPSITSDAKNYTIFQSKNNPQFANNIFSSFNAANSGSVYEFTQDDVETKKQIEQEEKLKEERTRQEELRKEEERKQELKRQEEEKRREETRRKQEELKRLEEMHKKEQERRQEELKKKIEEEKKIELKKKMEEEKKFKEKVERESVEITEEIIDEVNNEIVQGIMKEEDEMLSCLISYAGAVTEEILSELCSDICYSEIKAEKFWTEKLMRKWFYIWRRQFLRNLQRRDLLAHTPVWLADRSPIDEASHLRRFVESAALKNMNAIHRGYKFTGELRQLPPPEPYNIMDIVRSSLLKRMKQIHYPYGKCVFWKVSLVSPGVKKWLYRKIEIEKWLLDAFSDKKEHDISESLIYVQKQSWKQLIDFAISVSLTNKENTHNCGEAMEGTNALLFFMTEKDHNYIETIEQTLKHKYPYQILPVAVVIPNLPDMHNSLERVLSNFARSNIISAFRIFIVDPQNISQSLDACTKSALKWLAKRYPQCPPLEIDHLKSVCERYLGNEIWSKLKSEQDTRLNTVVNKLHKLIECYNIAVDKLTKLITNEDFFNYPSFPLEFKKYLDDTSPYPKPYEFISCSVKTSENTFAIKDAMKQLKLPSPVSEFNPSNVVTMQNQIRKYCNQIGWFVNPEQVVCKVVADLPIKLTDATMPCEQFSEHFKHYNLIDFLNIVVYEKIHRLNNSYNLYAIYEKSALEDYRNVHWLYEIDILSKMKHKAPDHEDELDVFIEAKRRKTELDSLEYLMLEDTDCTLVEESIKETEGNISRYNNCQEVLLQLETQLEEENKKSVDLENLLRAALSDV